jgi:hypothetical protein
MSDGEILMWLFVVMGMAFASLEILNWRDRE